MDQARITNYVVRAAAFAVFFWFSFLGAQRAIVDHVVAVQNVKRLSTQVTRLQKEVQTLKIREQARKLAPQQ